MSDAITSELRRIECDHGVRILYACESGSRAWGFESVDSDYDPRFIYVHPRDWYLSIEQGRDVIEEKAEGDLDLAGWELRKAFRLFRKSNPPMMEWLSSPLVYMEDDVFMSRLRALVPVYYSPARCFLPYRSMAHGNFREYLQGEMVRYKKYLYVLRPVLACLWIERQLPLSALVRVNGGERGSGGEGFRTVPVRFLDLIEALIHPGELRSEIDELLRLKRAAAELDERPRSEPIHAFLRDELERLGEVDLKPWPLADPKELNELFRSTLE